MKASIVVSPKNVLTEYDWRSAVRGLVLMFSTASALFLIGFLEGWLKDPSMTIDWKATALAYLGAVSVAVVTFGVNLLKKFVQENKYIE